MIAIIGATSRPIQVPYFKSHDWTRDSLRIMCFLKQIYINNAGRAYPLYWYLLEASRFGDRLVILTEANQFILQWRWPFVSMCSRTKASE